jgi:hypothetical protein
MEGEGEEKGHSYKECVAWLAADAIVVGKEQLRKWRDWYYLRSLRQQSRDDARTLLESEAQEGETIPEEKIQRIGNQLFAMMAIKERDVQAWAAVQNVQQNERRLAQNEEKLRQSEKSLGLATRKVEMLERKMQSALDQLSAAKSKGGVTPETLEKIEQTLKLL